MRTSATAPARLVLLLACAVALQDVGAQRDIFALLLGTLRTYQRAGCDNDVVTLKCPAGTSITVQIAQYGNTAPSKSPCGAGTGAGAGEPLQPADQPLQTQTSLENKTCLLPNSIQYSLLQTVVEACQKKHQCQFKTSPRIFGGDPCPGVPKYVEVAYKCRPYEFRSKVVCENDKVQLKCNPNSRVAVYSANYGRTQYESIQCPQPQGVPEETCLASYATETVMHLCHGKRNCELAADVGTFGNPCKQESRTYLKVVYTCVPRKVLKSEFEGPLEGDETEEDPNDVDDYFVPAYEGEGEGEGGNEYIRESAAPPPVPNSETVARTNLTDAGDGHAQFDLTSGFILDLQKNYVLYTAISASVCVLLLAGVLLGRVVVQRHRTQRDQKFYTTSISDHTLANGFTDDISEVDADIDLQTAVPMPMAMPTVSVQPSPSPMGTIAEVVRYPQYPDYPVRAQAHAHAHSHTFRGPPGPPLGGAATLSPPRSLADVPDTAYYYG